MNEPELPQRRIRPRVRDTAATYFVTWNLHRQQPALLPAERQVVADTLRHFDHERYELHAWVVMDDHMHVVVTPLLDWPLDAIVASWRSFAANRLVRDHGRAPPVWLRDGYDRVVLPESELAEKVEYVKRNPWRRWPELDGYIWVGPVER